MRSRPGWGSALLVSTGALLVACSGLSPGSGTHEPPSFEPSPTGGAATTLDAQSPTEQLPTPTAEATDTPTGSPTPTTSLTPSAFASYPPIPLAKDYLECKWVGGSGFEDPWEGFAWGDTPAGALDDMLTKEFRQAIYPQTGYERLEESEHVVVLAYAVDGAVKVALVVASEPPLVSVPAKPWVALSVAKCDLSELGVDVVLPPGIGVWRNVELNLIGIDFAGTRHCAWQSARFLTLGDDRPLFTRDPEGIFEGELNSPYLGDTTLPDDAVDTGYRREGDELWRDRGGEAMYVVSHDRVERWPKWPNDSGCA